MIIPDLMLSDLPTPLQLDRLPDAEAHSSEIGNAKGRFDLFAQPKGGTSESAQRGPFEARIPSTREGASLTERERCWFVSGRAGWKW